MHLLEVNMNVFHYLINLTINKGLELCLINAMAILSYDILGRIIYMGVLEGLVMLEASCTSS